MKRIGMGRPKSNRLHNEMHVGEGKTTHVSCTNNQVTIDDLVRIEIKFSKCLCTNVVP